MYCPLCGTHLPEAHSTSLDSCHDCPDCEAHWTIGEYDGVITVDSGVCSLGSPRTGFRSKATPDDYRRWVEFWNDP
jgi:Zn-finger nucleic acid-binding protein